MADSEELLMAEGIGDAGYVIAQLHDIIRFNSLRLITAAVATLVRDRDLKPGRNQGINLMPPQTSALRKAMQKDDEGAVAFDNRT
jgi:hypothetical protein